MIPPEHANRRAIPARRFTARAVLLLLAVMAVSLSGMTAGAETAGSGTVSGRVFDGESGAAIAGATVVLDFPEPADGSQAPQHVATTGPAGDYEFDAVPAGAYGLSFIKSGYRASVIANFEVVAGKDNVANFPMPRATVTESGDIMELDAFVVEASVVGDMMNNLELRMESDQLVNLLSAEDLSKFAASDVADALKRVAGVNIVEGQFAIIRGLEDRYSSTLYNGAPIPSPDPDSQSVQLDLFSSDIVSNLNIGKSFAASSPSNSSGGSINIVTHDYPEELTFKFTGSTGFNERTLDEFIRFDRNSPVGVSTDGEDTIESDFSAFLGGRKEFHGREVRFKVVVANEIDYDTRIGSQGVSEPRRFQGIRRPDGTVAFAQTNGGISTGTLDRRGPQFDFQQSARQEQRTYYVGFGFDFDTQGKQRVDGSYFFTRKKDELAELRDNAFIPGFDYSELNEERAQADNSSFFTNINWLDHWFFDYFQAQGPAGGAESGRHAYFSPIYESRTFDRERDLSVYQLNGDHDLGALLEGLKVTWVANYAETKQEETTFNARYSLNTVENFVRGAEAFTAPGPLPAEPTDFVGTPLYVSRSDIVYGTNDIDENQYFGRFDFAYEFDLFRNISGVARTGYWFEQANRDVQSRFLVEANGDPTQPGVYTRDTLGNRDPATFDPSQPSSQTPTRDAGFSVVGYTPIDMGRRIYDAIGAGDLGSTRPQKSRTKREISAWNGELKLTFWEDVDLVAGLRVEDLRITSVNDPYTGFCGSDEFVNNDCPNLDEPPTLFPLRSLFLDRIDNPAIAPEGDGAFLRPGRTFNDQILGLDVEIDPATGFVECRTRACLDRQLRGEIDELFVLPAVSSAYRPWEGWVFRFAYSQTVARPSFRELGYYASQESGSDDFFVGNPQLTTSDVENIDGRVEWTFGDFGDLLAVSVFYKTIQDPIEQIILIDEDNLTCTGVCVFRTFVNNRSQADLVGMELEGRRTLDFIGGEWMNGFLETVSLGGNFTYIDAQVERNEIQRQRSQNFVGISPADAAAGLEAFTGLKKNRRLFGQPEWIVNADVTFDHPKWGTKATLSVFAISEVLDAIGSSQLSAQRGVIGFSFDRYIDKFYQLDLVVSQVFSVPGLPGEFTAKVSAKNLTDSTRKIIYDQNQTIDDISERSFKVGRDYTFGIGYTFVY